MQNNSSSKNNVTYINLQNKLDIVGGQRSNSSLNLFDGQRSKGSLNLFDGQISNTKDKEQNYNQFDFYKKQANNNSGPLNIYNQYINMTPLQLVGGMKSNKENKCDFCNHAISNLNNSCSNCSSSFINLLN